MKELTELVFILDRSGSMQGLEKDVVGGFNAMLKKQKKEEGAANVTTILFDDVRSVLYNREDIKEVRELKEGDYLPGGCTALLDAIGETLNDMIRTQKQLPKELRAKHVLFVISTDGQENASRHFGYREIRKMIETQKEKYGWEFLFLGAEMNAIEEASKLGIDENRAVRYTNDKKGLGVMYEAVSAAACDIRSSRELSDYWKKEIEKHNSIK